MFVIVKNLIEGAPARQVGSNEFNFDAGESSSGKPPFPSYKLSDMWLIVEGTCSTLQLSLSTIPMCTFLFNVHMLDLQEN